VHPYGLSKVGMDVPCDETDRQLFSAATKVTLGDGAKALFWRSTWLDGASPKDIAPDIFQQARRTKQYSRRCRAIHGCKT